MHWNKEKIRSLLRILDLLSDPYVFDVLCLLGTGSAASEIVLSLPDTGRAEGALHRLADAGFATGASEANGDGLDGVVLTETGQRLFAAVRDYADIVSREQTLAAPVGRTRPTSRRRPPAGSPPSRR